MSNELDPCPFCKISPKIQITDDEGNFRDESYLNDPWSGVSYGIVHEAAKDVDCPIATHPEELLGSALYDTLEEAAEAWNPPLPQGDAVFKYTDVVGEGYEGYLNLHVGDYPIALVPPEPAKLIRTTLQQQAVDVEGLKKARFPFYTKIKKEDYKKLNWGWGWEHCIDHLADQGYLCTPLEKVEGSFQDRVGPWMQECFGPEISADTMERNHRFLEEALELVQACGCSKHDCLQLVDYVYGRPLGDQEQEVGGVRVTLAALCLAQGIDMHAAGERELTRISNPEMIKKIRNKQATKPAGSPLPQKGDEK